jgi:hypothetical protein
VTASAKSKNDVPVEASIPDGAVSLESILCTEELRHRAWRPPDYGKENRALVALASALAESPRTILQTLAETILEVTRSDSAGVSLLTTDDGGRGSIGRPSPAYGNRTSAAGPRTISVPAETCSIVIFHCCSGTSSAVTPISNQSRLRQ